MHDTPARYVVITFGGRADGYCTLSHCPMDVIGFFPTRDAAKEYAATLPEWQQPHTLQVMIADA